MTPETIQASEPAPQGMSELSRISGVFFEPQKTFEDVAARPRWLIPVLLVIVAAVAMMIAFGQRVGWERFMRHQLETNTRMQQVPPEQRERILAQQVRFAPIGGYAAIVVGVPVYYLIASGVLLAIVAGIMSAPVRFKQVFAVMAYAGLPGVVYNILAIIVMFLKNPDDFNMQNPLVFNPGAFMDPTANKFMYSLMSSLDLFSFWGIFLIATGLKAAAGKRLSFGGALFAVILPWAVYVLGKSALAGMFS